MTVSYNVVGDSNGKSLTVIFSDGSLITVPSTHPTFERVLGYLLLVPTADVDEDVLRTDLEPIKVASEALTRLSERVTLVGTTLLFDGDVIETGIEDHIVRLLEQSSGSDEDDLGWMGLVNFLEKLGTNPDESSRESLYRWISAQNITITPEGDFIAYKGVVIGKDGVSLSVHSGTAFVNDVKITGQIPNKPGDIITMPRASVQTDRDIGCSTGLHAGTWSYASTFGSGRTLSVKINPRDVVSVPRDCNSQKLRVSRYEVIAEEEKEFDKATYVTVEYVSDDLEDDELDDDVDDYDEYDDCPCGCGYNSF